MGKDIEDSVLRFLNGGKGFLDKIDFTNIVSIPKIRQPESMSQFRLISLCNLQDYIQSTS